MTDLLTAAKQALEALERYQVKRQDFDRFADEITALRTAIEAAEKHEPFAWAKFDGEGSWDLRLYEGNENYGEWYRNRNDFYKDWLLKLYAHPAPAQEKKEPHKYGCHCDLEPGMKPDGCVIDNNRRQDCVYAYRNNNALQRKEDCEYWQPIEAPTIPAGMCLVPIGEQK